MLKLKYFSEKMKISTLSLSLSHAVRSVNNSKKENEAISPFFREFIIRKIHPPSFFLPPSVCVMVRVCDAKLSLASTRQRDAFCREHDICGVHMVREKYRVAHFSVSPGFSVFAKFLKRASVLCLRDRERERKKRERERERERDFAL